MGTERKKIGLIFISDDIGVVYYLVNVVKTLNSLNDLRKPEIIIFYNSKCESFLKLLNYKYLKFTKLNKNSENRLKLYLKSFFKRDNLFYKQFLNEYILDGLFPFNDFPAPIYGKTKVVSWIPDFQHKFYPKFFKTKNLFLREKRFKSIINNSNVVVLSSNDAFKHLKQFYKIPVNLSIKVLQFVSMIKDHTITPFNKIKELYQINLPYFLVSNQFYEHKNHIVVLKAIRLLKKEGLDFQVIFTGKKEDYRNPKFYSSLLKFIKSNDLESHLTILGMIPREDQLSILLNSLSVIQPSKFEGWSTIIEDAKTLRHQIICSSIPVHVEQLGTNGFYFKLDSYVGLAEHMRNFIKGAVIKKEMPDNYNQRLELFAESFIEIFN